MASLRDIANTISGFQYMIENLEINSGIGRRSLLNMPFITDETVLSSELDRVAEMHAIISSAHNQATIETLQIKLQQLHDIHGTIQSISLAANLDDIELFEVKRFCLLAMDIRSIIHQLGFQSVTIPNLSEPIDILDPDNLKIPHFYIYSSYSIELAQLRKQLKTAQENNEPQTDQLRNQCIEIEDQIRQKLSTALFDFASALNESLNNIAYIDVLLAKAIQAKKLSLCKPSISAANTQYNELVNPQIKSLLEQQNKHFQSIDIHLYPSPCLITGANMGGKTVLLKTIALAQYLFQFGFFIPAKQANIAIVDNILLSMGDEQSELNGLSSYASEMIKINQIIQSAKNNQNILALIDELARTTNPDEGKAIVNATIDILSQKNTRCLITTHYSGIRSQCRKLRVKGIQMDKLTEKVNIENINNLMDYTLIDDNTNEAPMEALQIATIMGIDCDLIKIANTYLKK